MTSAALTSFSRWLGLGHTPAAPGNPPADGLAYRLRSWPELPDGLRTARIYRLLSTMTVRPVTRTWMQLQSGMGLREIDSLLGELSQARVLVTIGPGFSAAAAG